ncbi:MAG: 2OG-Fe(II) oxygenase family protein [Pseudomonadota bacterium]
MATQLINPALDIGALRARFQERGRITIEQVLRPEFADTIHTCLAHDVPWRLAWYRHDRESEETVGRLTPAEQEALGPEGLADLERKVMAEAGEKFQYLYDAYDVLKARREGLDPGLRLQEFLSFLGTDELFGFIEEVSGDSAFNRVDCHACRYRPGHFLRQHADRSPFEQRHMAYVFQFTRDWHLDFGGLTTFQDESGHIEDCLVPRFNSLTLFKVPVLHSVSQVAAYAPHARHSITGWFTRYD